MSTLSQDFRFALRGFQKSPVFTGVAVLSLALGIGANTAIFTLMDQVLLRMLPVRDPERLVLLDQPGPNQGSIRNDQAFSYPMYTDIRDKNEVFTGALARFSTSAALTYKGNTQRLDAEVVSGNYFDVLGLRSAHGRLIGSEDDRSRGAHPVVVLSHSFWKTKFGGETSIVGQKVLINGHPMDVIGVAQPGFQGLIVGDPAEIFVPIMMKAQMTPTWDDLDKRRVMFLNIFARLKPGLTKEQAQASLQPLYKQILQMEVQQIPGRSKQFEERFLSKSLLLTPGFRGKSDLRQQAEKPLFVLMGMVGLVLLIACANVANLLMARAAARQKEMAIRLALGASRWQIVKQLLVESVTLSTIGGLLGLLVAVWTGDVLLSFVPSEGALEAFNTAPDKRVLAYNAALTIFAAMLFGLAPALQALRSAVANTLKDEAGNVSLAASQVRFRKGLVVAQIALSLLLLVGAGLFARSLYNLKSLNPGFDSSNLITFGIDPSLAGFEGPRLISFFEQLRRNLANLPGVESASMVDIGTLSNDRNMSTVKVEGYESKEGENMNPDINIIGPAYFATMRMQLVSGREFSEADGLSAPKVCIINEEMARKYFGGRNPLGLHIYMGRGKTPFEIVGVARNNRAGSLKVADRRYVYFPVLQDENPSYMTFSVRTGLAADQLSTAIRREVQRMDANVPVVALKTMEKQVSEFLYVERLISMLSAFFGFLAMLLAAVGLYGVMAFTVTRRTREIGVRMALGAERNSVLWLVLREVTLLTAIGIAVGIPAAAFLSKFVRAQLFGLEPTDPLTLVLATMTLLLVALTAGYIPARRATRIDPMVALRYE